jgi:hypothetical protein
VRICNWVAVLVAQVGQKEMMADPGFRAWLEESKSWSQTYAAFKVSAFPCPLPP